MGEGNDLRGAGPEWGNLNTGAVAGAVVGSIGGLFAVGIPPAIVFRSFQAMFSTPKLAVICFIISGLLGMVIGGLLGPRIGRATGNPWAEFIAGGVSGLVPVAAVLWWSYYMVTTY